MIERSEQDKLLISDYNAEMIDRLNTQAGLEELTASIHKDSYYEFFKDFWGTIIADDLVDNWHIKYVCDELQIVGERIIKRLPKLYDLSINIPPGESKSTMGSVMFPVWLWIRDPSIRIISGSCTISLSMDHSGLSRDIIRSDLFQRLYGQDVRIRRDSDAKTFYKNTAGGSRQATSALAKIIGKHSHLLLLDDGNDPDPKKLASPEQLQAANKWKNTVLLTRKTSKKVTPLINIQQRLAVNDMTGDMLEQAKESPYKKVKQISIPAEDSFPIIPAELTRFYVDGLMNPTRNGRKELAEARIELGASGYAAQQGMQPVALEGNIIKDEMIRIMEPYQLPEAVKKKNHDFVVDTAFKDESTASPSALLKYVEHDGYCYILEYAAARLTFGRLVKFLYNMTVKLGNNASRIYIEDKATGDPVMRVFKNPELSRAWGMPQRLNVIPYKLPPGGKVERVRAVTPYMEAGRVIFVNGPYLDDYLLKLKTFPRSGTITEPADLLAMALTNTFDRKIAQGYSVNG